MLKNLNLDDETFSEILEKAKGMIPELTSEWTDHNMHDPGITFLELFAWKKEMQQFRMDQIGEKNRRKYLELLGGSPRDLHSAEALLHIPARETIVLPKGTCFYAGNLCFETTEEEWLGNVSVSSITCTEGKEVTGMYTLEHIQGDLGIPLFGTRPKEGNAFILWLSGPLENEFLQHIWFDMKMVERNPFSDSFLPLAKIRIEILTDSGWEKINLIKDETHAFLTDGRISFYIHSAMRREAAGYPIRFSLEENGYDTVPVLMHIGMHRIKVVQQHTLACCEEPDPVDSGKYLSEYYRRDKKGFIPVKNRSLLSEEEQKELLTVRYESSFYEDRIAGTGTGFPCQQYKVKGKEIAKEGFRILIEEYAGCGYYHEWQQVDHLGASGPEDLHFTIEEDTICFGNGYRGRMPEGEIRIIACHTCSGEAGNIRANMIDRWETEKIDSVTHEAAIGGRGQETIAEALERTRQELEQEKAVITPEDYCTVVRQTPGLCVKACEAELSGDGENKIILSVAQDNMEQKVSDAFLQNVAQHLEKRIPIGTSLKIIPCRKIGISVLVEVNSKSHGETVKAQINKKLEQYFKEREEKAGVLLSRSEIYKIVESADSVQRIRTISMENRSGGVSKKDNGDLQLPPGGLAFLKELECRVVSAE